jgi:phosphoribosylcarboxyaminoimidazole (NCAIR) mutase
MEVEVTRRGRGALGAAVSVEEAEAVETRPSCIDSDLLSAAGTCVGKSGKRAAQDAFEAFVPAVHVVRFLGEDSTDVTLAKAETSQGSESLRSHLSDLRPCDQPVVAAVSVLEAHPRGDAACDTELSVVGRPVMDTTQGDEIVSVVQAALGAELEVVNVDENCIFAAWNRAPVVVATEHRPARRRSDGLLRPDARVGASPTAARHGFRTTASALVDGSALVDDGRMDQPQVLTVALRHGRDLRPDGHQLP